MDTIYTRLNLLWGLDENGENEKMKKIKMVFCDSDNSLTGYFSIVVVHSMLCLTSNIVPTPTIWVVYVEETIGE